MHHGKQARVSHGAAIELQGDFSGKGLRRLARSSRDAKQVRRLLALAVILDGGSRTEAARIGGVTLQIVQDWVLRFNAEGPDGLIHRKAPGKAPTLTAEQRAALRGGGGRPNPARRRGALAADRPRAVAVGGVPGVGERGDDGAGTAGARLPQALGASAALRPEPGGGGAFKKVSRSMWTRSGPRPGTRVELWFQDEARIGQKNKITRRWARRGTRPRAPHDQRTAWAHIFGDICPAEGKGAGLVMPFCDTAAMQTHLIEISATVAPDAHAVLILDQAGWHLARALAAPENITILPLPPRPPELNPVENVWQFRRDNWLSNRVFKGYDDIVAHGCVAWTTRPWHIRTIGRRAWAKRSDQCRLV